MAMRISQPILETVGRVATSTRQTVQFVGARQMVRDQNNPGTPGSFLSAL